MFTKASTLLRSMTLPSLDSMKPRMVPKNTMNTHLSRFRLILNFLHLRKHFLCHNPSLGLVTKVRACRGVGQEGSLGVTSHAPKSVGECEGMNTHTFK
jgi:hypothetical protein